MEPGARLTRQRAKRRRLRWNTPRDRLTRLIWQVNDDHNREGAADLNRHLTKYVLPRAILHEAREHEYEVDELERFALACAKAFARK